MAAREIHFSIDIEALVKDVDEARTKNNPSVYMVGYLRGFAGAPRGIDIPSCFIETFESAYRHGERVGKGLEEAPEWARSGASLTEVADG
jgi:hypothetical protein